MSYDLVTSEPTALDTLTMRASGDSRGAGNIAGKPRDAENIGLPTRCVLHRGTRCSRDLPWRTPEGQAAHSVFEIAAF